jgi:transcriptional regulator with XRE-family HTH domain
VGIPVDIETLVARRKALGITQEVLARKVGRTNGAIGNIERGSLLPSAALLDRIADVLQVTPWDLTDHDPDRTLP